MMAGAVAEKERDWPRLPFAQPGFLPLDQAAMWAGVSERTLKRWIAQGLPKYQAGPRTKVLVRPGDIERFLTRKEAQPPPLNQLVDEVFQSLMTGRKGSR
jgi:hypothetical protein